MKTKNSFLLILTAFIWGVAFVAQSEGGDVVGPYTFNCIRCLIGAIFLLPVIQLLDKCKLTTHKPNTPKEKQTLFVGGIACGIILCVATNLQQLGIYLGASAGKAGFLTACYIVLVPILSLFLKKKCGLHIWIAVLITLAGLYLLCMKDSFSLAFFDILLLLCAICFAIHILTIDHFSPLTDGVRMSCIQFFTAGILSLIPMIFSEMIPHFSKWLSALTTMNAWIPILYAGILSCGVAYTLQIIGQKDFNPTIASLLMSLESVFSVIAGFILLGETMSGRELLGCGLIFVAVILAQLPISSKKPLKKA